MRFIEGFGTLLTIVLAAVAVMSQTPADTAWNNLRTYVPDWLLTHIWWFVALSATLTVFAWLFQRNRTWLLDFLSVGDQGQNVIETEAKKVEPKDEIEITTNNHWYFTEEEDGNFGPDVLCLDVLNKASIATSNCQIEIFGAGVKCLASECFDLRIGETKTLPFLYMNQHEYTEYVPYAVYHNWKGEKAGASPPIPAGLYTLTVYSTHLQPQKLTIQIDKTDRGWRLDRYMGDKV